MSSGANAGGSGSDCEGEEQEESSSSLFVDEEVSDAVAKGTSKMNRPSYPQLEALGDFLTQNPGIAKGCLRSAHGKQQTKLKWDEAAITFNALGGAQKDGKGWAKCWADKKCALKKVCAQHAQSMRHTGDGAADEVVGLTPIDQLLVAVMGGPQFAAGDSHVAANPFPPTNDTEEDELSTFRQQWQRELETTPPQNGTPKKEAQNKASVNADSDNAVPQNETTQDTETSDFEKARSFFLLAAELERAGLWYESIQNYKRAMAINPNIELLLYQEGSLDKVEEETPEAEAPPERSLNEDDDEEEMVEGEDLLTRIQRIQGRKGVLCEPAVPSQGMHISWLPYEVVLLIARWVVSAELDTISLERLGASCRGLYLLARDHDIWRNICIRTWGMECGTPRVHGFASWRHMYLERPRLQLHGCYISKTNYLRHGETGFQDQFYRPWFLVQYYRYLRFFPEGLVMMLTTPDEPGASVGQLKNRNMKPGQGVMIGHYRLRGDKVVIVIKKNNAEKKSTQVGNTRFRSRRREPEQQDREQTFHIELQLSSPAGRRNMRLAWRGYSVCTRRDQWTQFELCPGKFPPFSFSRVRHYTRETAAPLSSVVFNGPLVQ